MHTNNYNTFGGGLVKISWQVASVERKRFRIPKMRGKVVRGTKG